MVDPRITRNPIDGEELFSSPPLVNILQQMVINLIIKHPPILRSLSIHFFEYAAN